MRTVWRVGSRLGRTGTAFGTGQAGFFTMNEGEWLTYAEAGRRLGISRDAARQRAKRGRWSKTLGNDGKRRIQLPDGWMASVRPQEDRPAIGGRQAFEHLIAALEAHIETLKGELALERDRTAKAIADTRKALADLEGERARTGMVMADYRWLSEEFERLTAQRAAARTRRWWQRPFLRPLPSH